MASEPRQTRRARRSRHRLALGFAGAFAAVLAGFAVVAVLLWILVR